MKLFEVADAMNAKTFLDLDDLHIIVEPNPLAGGDGLTIVGVTNCTFKVKRNEGMRLLDAWKARQRELIPQ
jgi:hypothetical protein